MSDPAPYLAAAARVLAAEQLRRDQLSPHAAALEAHRAGGPSVEEIEARISNRRGLGDA